VTPDSKSVKNVPVVTLNSPKFMLYQGIVGITLKGGVCLTHYFDRKPFGGYDSYIVDFSKTIITSSVNLASYNQVPSC
jgi:hypothetical protein